MKFFHRNSLIKELSIMLAITCFITFSASLVFYTITFHSLQNEKANYIENTAKNLTQNTIDIANSVMLMAETVSNTSYVHSFLTETSMEPKINYKLFLNRLISKLVKSTSHINNILLQDNTEVVYSFSNSEYPIEVILDKQYHIFSPDTYSDGFSGALYLPETDTTYYAYFQTIYDDITASNKKEIGTCIIICSCVSLNDLCRNAATSDQYLFTLLDSEDKILASNQEIEVTNNSLDEMHSKKNFLLETVSLPLTNWKLVCFIPYAELYSDLRYIQNFALLLITILLLTYLLLAYKINTTFVFPLLKIVNFLEEEPYTILHTQLKVSEKNEIAILATNINQMINEINTLTHAAIQNQARMYEMELSKNQAQLLALQTQINPHFLYNTLNSIKGLAYQDRINDICDSVDSLSYIMRYTLNGNNMTSIKNEFLCIEKYLHIIELRFPNRFSFRLNMDDAICNYDMPRFLLQPIVENAIFHGLEPSLKNGTLTLTVSLRDDSILHFECKDNGIGFQPDKLEELLQKMENTHSFNHVKSEKKSSIGLLNIHLRIRIIYGEPYGLTIYSNTEGTTICADFPSSISYKSVQPKDQ